MPEPRACRSLREGLTEYLENALPPTRRQGLEAHLAACARCRTLLEEVRCTIGAMAGLQGGPMPPNMKTALLQQFRKPPR